jgi:hypothetical protein
MSDQTVVPVDPMLQPAGTIWPDFISDNPIAFVAAAIAVCALGVSLWQGWLSRRHYRLSVLPHLDSIINTARTLPVLGISIRNNGLGPAVIVAQWAYVDDEEVKATDSASYHAEMKRHRVQADTGYLEPGSVLAAGATHRILTYEPNQDPARDSREVKTALFMKQSLFRFRLEIEYKSMYGGKHQRLSTDLSAYSRPSWVANLPDVTLRPDDDHGT